MTSNIKSDIKDFQQPNEAQPFKWMQVKTIQIVVKLRLEFKLLL